jgi:hypothetical protein
MSSSCEVRMFAWEGGFDGGVGHRASRSASRFVFPSPCGDSRLSSGSHSAAHATAARRSGPTFRALFRFVVPAPLASAAPTPRSGQRPGAARSNQCVSRRKPSSGHNRSAPSPAAEPSAPRCRPRTLAPRASTPPRQERPQSLTTCVHPRRSRSFKHAPHNNAGADQPAPRRTRRLRSGLARRSGASGRCSCLLTS